jgi:phosphate acetyltransferase
MHPMERIIQESKRNPLKIVLPEATDARMLKAAREAADAKIAHVTLLGIRAAIEQTAAAENLSLEGISIVDV